jgi:hypothetical protein
MKLQYLIFIILSIILLMECDTQYLRYEGIKVPERYGADEYYKLSKDAKKRYLRENTNYSDGTINAIVEKKVFKGMTLDQALFSWGRPYDIDKKEGSWGVYEKWIYDVSYIGSTRRYLYFKNGKLVEWNE